jgi:hypothetical protein
VKSDDYRPAYSHGNRVLFRPGGLNGTELHLPPTIASEIAVERRRLEAERQAL